MNKITFILAIRVLMRTHIQQNAFPLGSGNPLATAFVRFKSTTKSNIVSLTFRYLLNSKRYHLQFEWSN